MVGVITYEVVARSVFAQGNLRSNYGLYSWEEINEEIRDYSQKTGEFDDSPKALSNAVKCAAKLYGADLIGIAGLHPNWLYSKEFNVVTGEHTPLELPAELNRVVVLAVEMDYRTLRNQSMVIQGAATGVGYSRMAFVASQTAAFVRGLGYRAIPAGNNMAESVPLAMAAGLGEAGRMGLLITPRFGPRIRLAKVFTDMPLIPDGYKPFGVTSFCETCKLCAQKCPSQAISHGKPTTHGHNISNHDGVLKWYNNHEKCYRYWASRGMDCTQCIRFCPFNKPSGMIHDFTRFVIKRISWLNPAIVWLDSLMGYQESYHPDRFLKR